MKKIQRFGSVPFENFKQKNRIINQLRAEINGKIRIIIKDNLVVYEYYEFQ